MLQTSQLVLKCYRNRYINTLAPKTLYKSLQNFEKKQVWSPSDYKRPLATRGSVVVAPSGRWRPRLLKIFLIFLQQGKFETSKTPISLRIRVNYYFRNHTTTLTKLFALYNQKLLTLYFSILHHY
jgi:hypothetical protein